MKKHHNIIIITILFVIGFLFVHSELDFFAPEQHAHNTHDFCDIVDNAKPEYSNVEKLNINNLDVPVDFLSITAKQFFNSQSVNLYTFNKPNNGIHFSILYGSFLI